MNQEKLDTINLTYIIANNLAFLKAKFCGKLIADMDILQKNISNKLKGKFHFCKNIIFAVCGHAILFNGLTNFSKNMLSSINYLHVFIFHYNAIYKTP